MLVNLRDGVKCESDGIMSLSIGIEMIIQFETK